MQIKIGNNFFETFRYDFVNTKQLLKIIFPCTLEFDSCLICDRPLKDNYTYALSISKGRYIKLYGKACYKCDAFFKLIDSDELFKKFDIEKNYNIRYDYFYNYNKSKYNNLFDNIRSVYNQITICAPKEISTYTIVLNTNDADDSKDIIHYTSDIAVILLYAVRENKRRVTINGETYIIISVREKNIADPKVDESIHEGIRRKLHLLFNAPTLISDRTLYIYYGTNKCEKEHYIEDYKTVLSTSDNDRMLFYVEYCHNCKKFFMRGDYYKNYFKRYGLIPIKVKSNDKSFSSYEGREKNSPLRIMGYSVEYKLGYTSMERQDILKDILDYRLMEKHKVLNYLNDFIRINGKRDNMETAVLKWEEDKEFVRNYKLQEHKVVKIRKLERRIP